eukprot:5287950-Prymnesium_polylepis.1
MPLWPRSHSHRRTTGCFVDSAAQQGRSQTGCSRTPPGPGLRRCTTQPMSQAGQRAVRHAVCTKSACSEPQRGIASDAGCPFGSAVWRRFAQDSRPGASVQPQESSETRTV